MRLINVWILLFGVVIFACSKKTPTMPAAYPFPRVGLGEIEQRFRTLIEARNPTRGEKVQQRYRNLKTLIRLLLHEGAMVDSILTRSQGKEIESLLRHKKYKEASPKVEKAINRLKYFRESDEFARFRKELNTGLIPKRKKHQKPLWQKRHKALRRKAYRNKRSY